MVAQTDGYGKFELTKVPANAQLQVSYLGMKTAIIPLNGQTELNIELEQHTSNMPLSSSRVEERSMSFWQSMHQWLAKLISTKHQLTSCYFTKPSFSTRHSSIFLGLLASKMHHFPYFLNHF